MMTDRDLLEMAAKAAGLFFHGHRETKTIIGAWVSETNEIDDWHCWNPLADDGDALRLLVKLSLSITVLQEGATVVETPGRSVVCTEQHGSDPYAATRRAIVRTSAALEDHKTPNE